MQVRTSCGLYPQISPAEIIRLAESIGDQYRNAVGNLARLGIPFDRVYEEVIYPEWEIELVEHIDLGKDSFGNKILGKYVPDENVAFIDSTLRHDPRREFTCWHEVGGHGILQGVWLRTLAHEQCGNITTTEHSMNPLATNVLERQANLFASYAAAPTWFLELAFSKTFCTQTRLRYIGPGTYYFDVKHGGQKHHVESYAELCSFLAYYLKRHFTRLSREALGYRIEKSTLAHDATKARASTTLFRKERCA